jgi:hypothetical protein
MAEEIVVVPPAADPWYKTAGADPETIGHMQNRGWDTKTPDVVALEAIKAAREAQSFVGLPADRLIRLPADAADAEGMKAVWQRLGAPKDASEYDFSTIKAAGDKPIDPALADTIRAAAAASNLPKDAATRVAEAVVKHLDTTTATRDTEAQAALVNEMAALKTNWGQNYDGNMLVARNAAAALGVTPEEVAALEKSTSYSKVMEMFRNIGSKIGEDKFVISNGPSGGAKTVDQAKAEKAELKNDSGWVKRYLQGDVAAVKQMTALDTLIWSATPDYL